MELNEQFQKLISWETRRMRLEHANFMFVMWRRLGALIILLSFAAWEWRTQTLGKMLVAMIQSMKQT